MEMFLVTATFLLSVCFTVSFLARYAFLLHFPTSAFLNIGLTFVFSFFQIGLTATDIAFTKKHRAEYLETGQLNEGYDALHTTMRALWGCVYWGTILTGSVLMQFFKIYW